MGGRPGVLVATFGHAPPTASAMLVQKGSDFVTWQWLISASDWERIRGR